MRLACFAFVSSTLRFNPRTHEGCDVIIALCFNLLHDSFNPRTHEGCDPVAHQGSYRGEVSIHAPTKGATSSPSPPSPCSGCFNPRTHEGCDCSQRIMELTRNVSIHAPTKGATQRAKPLHCLRLCFNPRTHEGCDLYHHRQYSTPSRFNPRTHEGCDPLRVPNWVLRWCFNPRTHEGCDAGFGADAESCEVSIHAPTKGATGLCV